MQNERDKAEDVCGRTLFPLSNIWNNTYNMLSLFAHSSIYHPNQHDLTAELLYRTLSTETLAGMTVL